MFWNQWDVLLVDDEPDVLAVSRLALRDAEAYGIPLRLHTASSKAEAMGAVERLAVNARGVSALSVAIIDVVMETVGKATWEHSIRSLKPGGTLVVSGATTGDADSAQLSRVFFLQLSVIGSTMGTREELERLIRVCVEKEIRPVIDRTLPLAEAREGFQAMLDGSFVGKLVFTV